MWRRLKNVDWMLVALFGMLGVAVGWLIIYMSMQLAPSWWGAPTSGIVVGKGYSPPANTMYFIQSGDVLVPITQTTPATYTITISGTDGQQWTYDLSQEEWSRLKEDDSWERH